MGRQGGAFRQLVTSLSLVSVLNEQGIRATDTVRTDRFRKDLKMPQKNIKIDERGSMRTMVFVLTHGMIMAQLPPNLFIYSFIYLFIYLFISNLFIADNFR